MKKYIRFEVRSVDAYDDGNGWIWNSSIHVGSFRVEDCRDECKAFSRWLYRNGVKQRGLSIVSDCDIIELQDAATGEPLAAAIPA